MKKFKFFALTAFLIALISCTHSCEQDDPDLEGSLRELKVKFPVLKTVLFPNGRCLPKNEDFNQIEKAIFNPNFGYKIPETLVLFYKEVGNLRLTGIKLYTPEGGRESNLYNLIREGQEKKIPNVWLAFAKASGNEYYCINHKTEKICLYVVFPEIYMDEVTYPNLSSWIKKKWLAR